MSNWGQLRSLCHSMRWLLWPEVICLWLVTLLNSAGNTSHDLSDTIMWVFSVISLIWAIWSSTPPKDPPEK